MTSPAPAPETTSLDGTLERVVYQSPDDAWSVVKITPAGGGAAVTAVGKLLGVQPGESLRLEGTWEENDKFGRQFKVAAYRQVAPATVLGIEKYLGSGLIRGIGKGMAKRLVEAFGMDTLEVIERHPERLAEVPGIGPKRRADILAAWSAQQEIKEVMVFLQSHGVATSHAIRIYKTYGGSALSVVRSDPYRLATDVYGIGFKSADQIAASLGLPADSPERARAGLLYTLEQAAERGHVHLPRRELFEQTAVLLGVEEARLAEALPRLVAEGQVVVEALRVVEAQAAVEAQAGAEAPAIGGGEDAARSGDDAVFLRLLHAAEEGLAKALLQIARRPGKPLAIDVERALAWFEERESIELAEQQREAKALAQRKRYCTRSELGLLSEISPT
jgi:exodeoxyribonuclease V alpha subunit